MAEKYDGPYKTLEAALRQLDSHYQDAYPVTLIIYKEGRNGSRELINREDAVEKIPAALLESAYGEVSFDPIRRS